MATLSPEQLKELRKNLPPEIVEIYSSELTTERIQDIAEKHELHVDQTGELVNQVGYVMLGAVHPDDFTGELVKELEISKEKASAVAEDINETIFKHIRESLMKLHDAGASAKPTSVQGSSGQASTPPSPSPAGTQKETPVSAQGSSPSQKGKADLGGEAKPASSTLPSSSPQETQATEADRPAEETSTSMQEAAGSSGEETLEEMSAEAVQRELDKELRASPKHETRNPDAPPKVEVGIPTSLSSKRRRNTKQEERHGEQSAPGEQEPNKKEGIDAKKRLGTTPKPESTEESAAQKETRGIKPTKKPVQGYTSADPYREPIEESDTTVEKETPSPDTHSEKPKEENKKDSSMGSETRNM